MKTSTAGIVWFDRLLRLVTWLLAALTVIFVPLLALTLTGRGDVRVPVELDPPYRIEFAAGPAIAVHDGGIGEYDGFEPGQERANLRSRPDVVAEVRLDEDDRDTRAVLVAGVLVTIALVWVGLLNLRRVVAAARAGEPFDPANAGRLQRLGAAILVWPLLARITTRIAGETFDLVPAGTPVTPGPAWWVLVLLGAGMFALAEVLRVGTQLRELEQATV
jgi:hypothetical protein